MTGMVAKRRDNASFSKTVSESDVDLFAGITVFLGDTITVTYAITEANEDRRRTTAEIEIRNQRREVVCVATHLIKWLAAE